MPRQHIPYRIWLFRVIAWDGLLPLVLMGLPFALSFLATDDWLAILAVVLPIGAFFFRYCVGTHHIAENLCSRWMQVIQYFVFCFAIFVLVLLDAVFILLHAMPQGALAAEDWIVFGTMFSVYLLIMTFVMYPGRVGCGTSFAAACKLAEQFGFRQISVAGKHFEFLHPQIRESIDLIDALGEVHPEQLRKFMQLVERHGLTMRDEHGSRIEERS